MFFFNYKRRSDVDALLIAALTNIVGTTESRAENPKEIQSLCGSIITPGRQRSGCLTCGRRVSSGSSCADGPAGGLVLTGVVVLALKAAAAWMWPCRILNHGQPKAAYKSSNSICGSPGSAYLLIVITPTIGFVVPGTF